MYKRRTYEFGGDILKDNNVYTNEYKVDSGYLDIDIKFDDIEEWNVLDPRLYDIEFIYGEDKVLSYFAFRSLKIYNKKVFMNDIEIYQKLIF